MVQGPGRYGVVAVINDLDAVDVLVGSYDLIGEEEAYYRHILMAQLHNLLIQLYALGGIQTLACPLDHFVHCGVAVNMVIVEAAVGMVKIGYHIVGIRPVKGTQCKLKGNYD